jgi:hypothetical protein
VQRLRPPAGAVLAATANRLNANTFGARKGPSFPTDRERMLCSVHLLRITRGKFRPKPPRTGSQRPGQQVTIHVIYTVPENKLRSTPASGKTSNDPRPRRQISLRSKFLGTRKRHVLDVEVRLGWRGTTFGSCGKALPAQDLLDLPVSWLSRSDHMGFLKRYKNWSV